MKKSLTKFHFNLIEIMLAIVILALGMTSVFVLFPAGLNNHRTAMAENSIADMAETIISHVRAEAALKAEKDGFAGDIKLSAAVADPDTGSVEWESVSDPWTFKEISDGVYAIRQLSGPVNDQYVDFTAVAKVYKDENFEEELFVPFAVTGDVRYMKDLDLAGSDEHGIKDLKDKLDENLVLPLVVEISYPADVPYAERNKAYFRFEIFNEVYEVKEPTT